MFLAALRAQITPRQPAPSDRAASIREVAHVSDCPALRALEQSPAIFGDAMIAPGVCALADAALLRSSMAQGLALSLIRAVRQDHLECSSRPWYDGVPVLPLVFVVANRNVHFLLA